VRVGLDLPTDFVAYTLAVGWLDELRGFGAEGLEMEHRAFAVPLDVSAEDGRALAAVVSPVPASYLTGERAEKNLADAQWLAPRAVRHDQLLREAMACGPVVPMPFGTVFSSFAALTDTVRAHAAEIERCLELVRGRVEMGVKAVVDVPTAVSAWRRQRDGGEGGGGVDAEDADAGRKYLERKLRGSRDEAEALEWIATRCDEAAEALDDVAHDSADRDGGSAREDGKRVAYAWAFLVDADRVEAFERAVERANAALSGTGAAFEHSGPWPTFGFVPRMGEGQ
jgi:hypothetical protein